jgi:aerobic carbon-monoxide dehydrogenase small subunit
VADVQITVTVNGTAYTRDVEARLLLIHFIRDELRLTGSHWGCDTSNCGACVVWLDGRPVKACTILAAMADGHQVRTVEDLARGAELDPVQEGFARCHGLQCGFCTPGMLMAAQAYINAGGTDDRAAIQEALAGHICRCTGYVKIIDAVAAVARGDSFDISVTAAGTSMTNLGGTS